MKLFNMLKTTWMGWLQMHQKCEENEVFWWQRALEYERQWDDAENRVKALTEIHQELLEYARKLEERLKVNGADTVKILTGEGERL